MISDDQFSNWKLLNVYQDPVTKPFEEECQKEAEKLRKTVICADRTVTLAEILTNSLRKTAVYLTVDEIEICLSEIDFDLEFPI